MLDCSSGGDSSSHLTFHLSSKMSPKKHLKYLKKMWIDGACYEIPQTSKREKQEQKLPPETKSEVTLPQYPISADTDGKSMTNFRLPRKYYTELLWSKNKWGLDDLQKSTNTKITIPFNSDGNLTISGQDACEVAKARYEIHTVISSIRDRQGALQFISIPTHSPEITENFKKFKADVLELGIKGVDESVFQKPEKLHLTISVFTLLDEIEIEACSGALQEYKAVLDALVAQTGPLTIRLSGLNHFQEEPQKKVNVLFAEAKFTDDSSLQNVADDLFKHFYDKGFIKKPEKVKLHMTLINTKYRKPPPGQARQRWSKRESIDATQIMEKYKDFCFGEAKFDSVHLSLISSTGDDGFYKSLAVINLG